MILKMTVIKKGAVPGSANLTDRAWKNILKEAYRQLGQHWLKHHLKKRFTTQAGSEYDLTPRDPKYHRRKRQPRAPYVLSGELKADAPKGARVQPTFHNCKVVLPGARKVNLLADIYREEFLSVSPREETKLARIFEAKVQRLIDQNNRVTRRRIA